MKYAVFSSRPFSRHKMHPSKPSYTAIETTKIKRENVAPSHRCRHRRHQVYALKDKCNITLRWLAGWLAGAHCRFLCQPISSRHCAGHAVLLAEFSVLSSGPSNDPAWSAVPYCGIRRWDWIFFAFIRFRLHPRRCCSYLYNYCSLNFMWVNVRVASL